MEIRWIHCPLSVAELDRKKIKARARIGADTVLEGIAEVFARPSPDAKKMKVDVQFLVMDGSSHGTFTRFYLTESQAKKITKESGDGYELKYEGTIESS